MGICEIMSNKKIRANPTIVRNALYFMILLRFHMDNPCNRFQNVF